MKNKRYIRSYITVLVTGLNQVKLLNELNKEGILVKNARKIDFSHLKLTLRAKDRVKSFAILEKMCYTYSVEVYHGAASWLKVRLKRVGIVVGFALAFIVMIISSTLLTTVTVTGASPALCSLVLAEIKGDGIKAGTPVKNLDRAEIRKSVNAIDGIAECSVKIDGTHLVVTLTERKQEIGSTTQFTALVADKNAIVTKVVCRSGTAKVKCGDIIQEGQTLIEGALYDAEGNVINSVRADGEVYGVISEHRKYFIANQKIEYALTGKSKKITTLALFGLTIGKKSSPYSYYESQTTKGKLNCLLPISVKQTVYYETKPLHLTLTEEEIIELAQNRAREELFAGSDGTIKSNVRLIADGLYEVSVYLEREGLISKGI